MEQTRDRPPTPAYLSAEQASSSASPSLHHFSPKPSEHLKPHFVPSSAIRVIVFTILIHRLEFSSLSAAQGND
jgi:hypothetical protein